MIRESTGGGGVRVGVGVGVGVGVSVGVGVGVGVAVGVGVGLTVGFGLAITMGLAVVIGTARQEVPLSRLVATARTRIERVPGASETATWDERTRSVRTFTRPLRFVYFTFTYRAFDRAVTRTQLLRSFTALTLSAAFGRAAACTTEPADCTTEPTSRTGAAAAGG